LLKDYSVDDFSSLQERLADMWRYFTEDWLTIRQANNSDSERNRWPVADWWRVVQEAKDKFGTCLGMLRFHQKQCKVEHLEKMFDGMTLSLLAKYCLTYGDYAAEAMLRDRFEDIIDSSDFKLKLLERKSKMAGMSN
jgi:hypothetical protein